MGMVEDLAAKKDFNDMLRIFNEEQVRYVVIGGMATNIYGFTRYTKDLDLWVLPDPENAARVMRALEKYGAPMREISTADFEKEGTVFQIGVQPIRIDIITATVGVTFEEAYRNKEVFKVGGIDVPVIAITDLIKNKKAAGRPRDLDDAEHLEVILKRRTQKNAAAKDFFKF